MISRFDVYDEMNGNFTSQDSLTQLDKVLEGKFKLYVIEDNKPGMP